MQVIDLNSGSASSQTVADSAVSVRLPGIPRRYYWHGWQSWSLAVWTEASRRLPVSQPYLVHPTQLDPVYAFYPRPHGSWVGAVEMDNGSFALLGSRGTDAHVELDGSELRGICEANGGEWLLAHGEESSVFAQYANELGKRFGTRSDKPTPRVWCSWYSLYSNIDESGLLHIFDELRDLPFDVLQVDDGWQRSVGDWEANARFPSGMQTLAHKIRSTHRRAGIWLSPLIAMQSSQLFRRHPDWFLRDERGRLVSAGFQWGQQIYALDTTHPLVIQWLKALMQKMRAWGYDYVKLDYLFAGALPGRRHENMPREQAYRQALELMRDAIGDDAFCLASGAPIVPSLGLCDALRIGPDVSAGWESERDAVLLHNPAAPSTRNAIRTTMNRLWLRGLVQVDPDVVYFRTIECDLTPEQKALQQGLALICGFKATSDLPDWLTESERHALREFLNATPHIEQTGARSFKIDGQELDYNTATELAEAPGGWTAVRSTLFGWLANHRWVLGIDYDQAQRAWGKRKRDRRT